jgi:hypothetical protein
VNNANAIYNGGLAGNTQFFGSGTAEVVAAATALGSWNGDYSSSVHSGAPWFYYGGRSGNGSGSGVFAFFQSTGVGYSGDVTIGHRTILSGY